MAAMTLLETRIVLFSRLGSGAIATFDELIVRAGIVVEPFDELLVDIAFDALSKYGKGQGGWAQLNIVDCAAYAISFPPPCALCSLGSVKDVTGHSVRYVVRLKSAKSAPDMETADLSTPLRSGDDKGRCNCQSSLPQTIFTPMGGLQVHDMFRKAELWHAGSSATPAG